MCGHDSWKKVSFLTFSQRMNFTDRHDESIKFIFTVHEVTKTERSHRRHQPPVPLTPHIITNADNNHPTSRPCSSTQERLPSTQRKIITITTTTTTAKYGMFGTTAVSVLLILAATTDVQGFRMSPPPPPRHKAVFTRTISSLWLFQRPSTQDANEDSILANGNDENQSASQQPHQQHRRLSWQQQVENYKCIFLGIGIGIWAVLPFTAFHYFVYQPQYTSLPQWEWDTYAGAAQGAFMALVYRYAVRPSSVSSAPSLAQQVVQSFVGVRTLSRIHVSMTCTALPLYCTCHNNNNNNHGTNVGVSIIIEGKRRLHGLDLILFVCLQTSLVVSILSACLLGSRFALCSAGCGHNATFPPIIIIFILFRLNVPQLQQAAMC